MDIRPAHDADSRPIHDLVQRAYGHYVERIGGRPGPMDDDAAELVRRGGVWVAEDGGAIAGVLVVSGHDDHLLIENVAVEPDRQGDGLGRALLAFAEAEARRLGLSGLRLYTHVLMTENQAWYARHGFRETERRTEHGFTRVFMAKPIPPEPPA